ncbi:hypothetical protein SASPL_150546 [Salvia splendens]|uniref:DUF985 domain-containing protein n=1 Tax=Salvia splendens TaxID=180675 RepID=A0A8X8Z2X4_SALSN|nr:hypothetical protein SASPL_150546 [Salvia splendens]
MSLPLDRCKLALTRLLPMIKLANLIKAQHDFQLDNDLGKEYSLMLRVSDSLIATCSSSRMTTLFSNKFVTQLRPCKSGIFTGRTLTDIDISSDGAVKRATRDQEAHFSLVGCTCAPAFQFDDFELANRTELVSRFPKYESLITMLTFAE